ncbi:hypothetical protein MHEI_33060 [Mycobacterium heidelbergense]|nr:hypothetical protein MHEI_33060 [Mycobacterium heidelbergense]
MARIIGGRAAAYLVCTLLASMAFDVAAHTTPGWALTFDVGGFAIWLLWLVSLPFAIAGIVREVKR